MKMNALHVIKDVFFVVYFRNNSETLQIPYGKTTGIQSKLEEGFLLNEVVAAMRADMLLLVMYLWDSLRYEVS